MIKPVMAVCVVVGLLGLSPINASASGSSLNQKATKAIADCASDGYLNKRYPTKVLLRAIEIMPRDVIDYTNCIDAMHSAIFNQNRRAGAVINDCARDGDLDGSYRRATLRAALRILPADIDDYTNCRSVINNRLGALNKKARRKARR